MGIVRLALGRRVLASGVRQIYISLAVQPDEGEAARDEGRETRGGDQCRPTPPVPSASVHPAGAARLSACSVTWSHKVGGYIPRLQSSRRAATRQDGSSMVVSSNRGSVRFALIPRGGKEPSHCVAARRNDCRRGFQTPTLVQISEPHLHPASPNCPSRSLAVPAYLCSA